MKTFLVTGATGAVGSAITARLLQMPDVRVFAVVRAKPDEGSSQRLQATLRSLDVPSSVTADGRRVQALNGDVAQPRFGLSDTDYALLASQCTHLIHCAGVVRMNLPLDSARQAAVESARNVLGLAQRLADAGRLQKVEMVSTVGVAGRDHQLLREEWVGVMHRFHNTYEQAKAEAEQLAREAVRAGMALSVHRPSMVVGDSGTGRALHFQVFYFLVEFLSGKRTNGFFPEFDAARLDIVPVDFVAQAVVESSLSAATRGRILHLCAGPTGSIALKHLQGLIQGMLAARGIRAPKPRYVPRPLFRAAARLARYCARRSARAALGTLPVFLDYLDTEQNFDDTKTAQWLAQAQIPRPRPEDFLSPVLGFYFDSCVRGSLAE